MRERVYPHTADDLRAIAERMELIVSEVGKDGDDWYEDDWRYDLTVDINDEFGNTIGHVKAHGDGWLGFYPKEVAE